MTIETTPSLEEATTITIGYFNVEVWPSKYSDPNNLPLSRRELEALYFFSSGLSGLQVADRMSVSPHTVDTYKRRFFEKLGVDSIVQASSIDIAVACGGSVTKNS